MKKSILITGGCGFIGSHVVRLFVKKYPETRVTNIDKLTYAGNPENLKDIESSPNYNFVRGDIADQAFITGLFSDIRPDGIIHLAAESHVDRSILDPGSFINTNIIGTMVLLDAARNLWKDQSEDKLFYHVSTDEVYGSLGPEGSFTETTAYDPRSPYSASKAGSDHLVRAYYHTYGLPSVISNCSNNYGPNQFPEKLIPLVLMNIRNNKPIPVYGKGENIRDWLYVVDHALAIDLIFHRGRRGETYNIGASNEWKNIDLIRLLCELMDEKLGRETGTSVGLITFVRDREGHDMRYAIDPSKIRSELDWSPETDFREGLETTVEWYLEHQEWTDHVISGAYMKYYDKQYGSR